MSVVARQSFKVFYSRIFRFSAGEPFLLFSYFHLIWIITESLGIFYQLQKLYFRLLYLDYPMPIVKFFLYTQKDGKQQNLLKSVSFDGTTRIFYCLLLLLFLVNMIRTRPEKLGPV